MDKTQEVILEDGNTVTVKTDSVEVPQPVQTYRKEDLQFTRTMLQSQKDSVETQLKKIDELLSLLG